MEMILLKTICKNLQNFDQKILDIDFIAEKRVNNSEIEENLVSNLFNSIYKFNSISFIGINASGKTTTMNILSSILEIYLGNSSLSYKMEIEKYFTDFIEIESFYYDKQTSTIYKIWSKIKKDDEKKMLYFENETLYLKSITQHTNRENIFIFEEKTKFLERNNINNAFLKQEDSIFSSLMNKKQEQRNAIIDMCDVNLNILKIIRRDMVMNFVQYLDPSITKFEVNSSNKDNLKFKIRFKNSTKDIIVDTVEIHSILSSGTIKGINFLSNMCRVFKNGGYLLVDEIENHLNKTIVSNIIRMFNSDLNKNFATLLFSTHYIEILDTIDRSDSIYVLNKKQDIHINKFSKIAGQYDRIDKKKSDVILSGILETAPKYDAYLNLISAFKQRLEGGISND